MKSVTTLALFALATVQGPCEDIDHDPPAAGYAVVIGALPPVDGFEVRSDVRISCGLSEPNEFVWHAGPGERGSYRAELEVPADYRTELEEAGWTAACHIAAPAGRPPYAEGSGEVVFAPDRSARPTTTIDLVPLE